MVKIETESKELSIVLDACSEMLDKMNKTYFVMEKTYLKNFIAKIRDNGEVASDLRRYAKEILEG